MTRRNELMAVNPQKGFRDNGPYFQNKIEKVPFESRQGSKSPIRREYDIIFAFPNDR